MQANHKLSMSSYSVNKFSNFLASEDSGSKDISTKVFVIRDEQINTLTKQDARELVVNVDEDPYNNRVYVDDPVAPNAINLYVLGVNSSGRLTTLNTLVKKNLVSFKKFILGFQELNLIQSITFEVK